MKFLKMMTHGNCTTWGCEYDQNHMVELSCYFSDNLYELIFYKKEEEGGLGRKLRSWTFDYDPSLKEVSDCLREAMGDMYADPRWSK